MRVRSGIKTFGSEPLGYNWWLITSPAPEHLSNDRIASLIGGWPTTHNYGPGQEFADAPRVRRTPIHTLITQRVGLDV